MRKIFRQPVKAAYKRLEGAEGFRNHIKSSVDLYLTSVHILLRIFVQKIFGLGSAKGVSGYRRSLILELPEFFLGFRLWIVTAKHIDIF